MCEQHGGDTSRYHDTLFTKAEHRACVKAACYLSFFVLVLSTAAYHSTANNSARHLENNYWKLIALHGAPVAVFDNQSEPHVILPQR